MSTRCSIQFFSDGCLEPVANIYRHSDGYPSGTGVDLVTFFIHVSRLCADTRFSDPHFLAARYVVWLSNGFRNYTYNGSGHPLDFTGVGIQKETSGDSEYTYQVVCDPRWGTGDFPTVFVTGWDYEANKSLDCVNLKDIDGIYQKAQSTPFIDYFKVIDPSELFKIGYRFSFYKHIYQDDSTKTIWFVHPNGTPARPYARYDSHAFYVSSSSKEPETVVPIVNGNLLESVKAYLTSP